MFTRLNGAAADRGRRLLGALAFMALAISTLTTIGISTPATATQLEMKGEPGITNGPDTLDCPGGYATGLTARTGAWFDALGVICAAFDPATGHLVAEGHTNQSGDAGGSYQDRSCPPDQAIEYVQFSMFEVLRFDDAGATPNEPDKITRLDDIIFRCRPVTAPAPDYANDPNFLMTSNDAVVISGAHSRTPSIVGSDVNYGFSHNEICPDGEIAVGFRVVGKFGTTDNEDGVLQLGMDCAAVPTKLSPPLPPAPPGGHANFDRPGSDFKSYALGDPASCQAKCQADGTCKAWTWAVPGTNGAAAATCYLKNPAPAEVAASCCISGVPTALPPAQGGAKAGVDLPGSDFLSYTSNDQSSCALSCSKDTRCKAWTWAVAGTNGVKDATCYLKNAVPKEVANNCCVSGVPPTGGGLSSTGGPVSLPPGALSGTDRPGGDLTSGPSPNPADCAQSCGANGACKAWTWAVAGTNGQSAAICYLKNIVPAAQANNCCVSGLAPAGGAPAGGGSASLPLGAQANTDLPGGDIQDIPSSDPASCAQSCGSSPICKAWTWAVAGTNGSPQPRCYLKGVVPAPQANPCCVSGLKTAGGGASGGGGGTPPGGIVVPPGAAPGADRPGGDFAATLSPTPTDCAQACGNSPTCKAWTWAVAGTNGLPTAICYLKNVVPPQQANPCCVSGTKGGGGGGPGGAGSGPDFSGNWQTMINGSAPGTLTIFKAGSNWQGTYSALGMSGAISKGHIGGDGHLRFSWSQPGATGKGDFVLTGPSSFSGTFYFDANPGAVGSWNGHR